MVREDKKEHRGADVNRERERNPIQPCGPVGKLRQQQALDRLFAAPQPAHHKMTATCGTCEERGLERRGEGGTFLGHPRPAQAPVHPGTQRQPPRAAEVFRSLPQGGPGSLAVVTDPEEQCGGSGRGRGGDDGGRGEAAWRG